MKRTKLLLISILLTGFCLTAFSQVRTPKLLFTEFATTNDWSSRYFELTNMGDTILDLRDFVTSDMGGWVNYVTAAPTHDYHLRFSDVLDESNAYLDPGKSFTISISYEGVADDGTPLHRTELRDRSKLLLYITEANNEDLAPGEDSVSVDWNWMRGGAEGKLLFYKSSPTDSVLIDAINNWVDPATNKTGNEPFDVAGITDAGNTHVLIRKANITQGSLGIYEWPISAGNSPEESQWMLVPYDPGNSWNPVVFTTVGNHGVSVINISSETLTIDDVAGTITVPWGIRKGTWDVTNNRSQGIFDEITWGEGMAWNYEEHGDTATSACQTGDTLNVYAFGNQLIHKAYKIITAVATTNNALALPKRQYDNEYYNSWLHGSANLSTPIEDRRLYQPYLVTEGVPGMDTIGNLPFAVRIDSLLAYIEIAPGAKTEIIYEDDVERIDLQDGDILRVTAADNSTVKDYYLSVNDVVMGTNAFLSAITWPDVNKDEAELLGFKGDTIPGFSPTKFSYTLIVPFGTTNVPALSYFKEALNSTVKVDRAITLNGTPEDMTTTITVSSQDTSEADGVVNVYKIRFMIEEPTEFVQKFSTDPIFSEITYRLNGDMGFIEIANLGNQPINMENYMILMNASNLTPAEAIANLAGPDSMVWRKRYTKYIPGLKHGTWEEWQVNPAVMLPDGNVNPIVEPGGTFVVGRLHPNFYTDPAVFVEQIDQVDIHWSPTIENSHGETGFLTSECLTRSLQGNAFMLFKILNPAVRDGSKPVTDPLDFELVDLFGSFAWSPWNVDGLGVAKNNENYRKKPNAWRPNILQNGGFAANPEDSDWVHRNINVVGQDEMTEDLGNYSHDPITIYMSTVGSTAYLVDGGYQGNLNIVGVATGSKVEDVFNNLIPADTGQNMSVISLATSLVLDSTAIVSNGDTLVVVSADKVNTTKYVLKVTEGGLDTNARLIAKDGSGLTVTIDGTTGTITGIALNTPISAILDQLIKPELAVLNIIDVNNNLVPLQSLNPDTVMVQTLLVGKVYFEVVAQNQIDIITYELVLDISASDAWVSSNVYTVNQENNVISLIPEGISVETFLANLIPSGNATIEVLTRDLKKRASGYVVKDDILRVTSEDGTKTVDYLLWILNGEEPVRPLSTEAFVTSTVYTVAEGQLNISQIPAATEVAAFLANLVPALGAEIKLVDGSGNAKTSGTVVSEDKVVVTAEDGVTTATYILDVLVSTRDMLIESISIYPNPASDFVYMRGVPEGSTISLTSITGQKVRTLKALAEPLEISVEGLAKGYYIINVTDSNQTSAQFRFVKY